MLNSSLLKLRYKETSCENTGGSSAPTNLHNISPGVTFTCAADVYCFLSKYILGTIVLSSLNIVIIGEILQKVKGEENVNQIF